MWTFWRNRGARLGCVFGIALGILGSLMTFILVLTTPELAHDPSGGVIIVFLFILCEPLLAGAFCSIFGACLGVVFEPHGKEDCYEPPPDA